jgi:hypothetical protein
MNSRDSISLSEFSRGRWADEPPEPPPHPTELKLAARMRAWLSESAPLTRAWPSLTALAPLTFARYLIAFFIGVVVTAVWQSYRSGPKEETVAAAPAALDSMRQSIDKLAAEMTRMRAVEQDILERISAPPPQQPVAAPASNPAQRSSPVR